MTSGLRVAILACLALAGSLSACGDDEEERAARSTTSEQTGETAPAQNQADANGKRSADTRAEDKGDQDESSETFKPRRHDDTGGGSEQFRVKGGDNSVQEFGEEADPEEFEAAARALHNFLDARAGGEWAAACEYLTREVIESFEELAARVKQLKISGCPDLLKRLTNPAAKDDLRREAVQADVGSVRVEGERAFVIYRGIGGAVLAISMLEEDSRWKVASLAGVPLS